MRRLASVFALLIALSVPAWAFAQDAASGPPIDIVKVEGAIDAPLLGYLDERIDAAVADGAVLVVQLDSPGTLDQDAVALADRIAGLPIPVIVWVGTVPARAGGGALLIMEASSLAAVAPGSQTGPLLPLDVLHPDADVAGLDAAIDGWLAARGRDADRTQEDRAMTAQEALDNGFAEEFAPSVLDLLIKIDGREVPTSEGMVTLDTKIATTQADLDAGESASIRFHEPGPITRVQHAMASPSMVYFVLLFAVACLAFELTQPGFGFAGFSGLFLLGLALYGIWIVPPSWVGLAMLLAGVGLLIADVVARRLAVLTAAGMVSMVAGSLLVYRGVAEPMRISPWLIGGIALGSLLYYGFGLTVAIQSRDRIFSTQQGLIGLLGEARGRLAPDGPVHVKGAMWRGRSIGDPIASGTPVRVRGVDGLMLRVEAEPGAPPDGQTPPAEPV
ncbi:MAG: NfeD family protein [Actinomycetota bacterium]